MNTVNMAAITKQINSLTINTGSIFFSGSFMNPKVISNPSPAVKRELGGELCSLTIGPGPMLLLSVYDDRGMPRGIGWVDVDGDGTVQPY